ncbi:DUF5677 domain-containing protein [Elusimicrobiota bacterium]
MGQDSFAHPPESGDKVAEFRRLFGLYIRAVDTMAHKLPPPGKEDCLRDAEPLAIKLSSHLATLLYIHSGTKLQGVLPEGVSFTDFSSSAVLARSAFETFLTFHFIFVSPGSADELRLRYLAWCLRGLSERKRFGPSDEAGRQVLARDAIEIDKLNNEIHQNPAYLALPKNQQKLARKGDWRFGKPWAKLAENTDLGKAYGAGLYAYLSSYAHSGYLSALQISQATSQQDQCKLAKMYVGMCLVLMSHFLCSYAKLFSSVAEHIESNPKDKALLDMWYWVGRNIGEAETT